MIVVILLLILFLGEILFYILQQRSGKSVAVQKTLFRVIFALSAGILIWVGVLDGLLRYGGLLFILAVQVILFLIRSRKEAVKIQYRKGTVVRNVLLYTLTLSFAIVFPQYEKPALTGPYHVQTEEHTWTDTNRIETYSNIDQNRYVTLKIWYPEEKGRYPLILFSHGATGILESNAMSCEELASNGYVVVAVAHPYQAFFTRNLENGQITLADSKFLNQVLTDNGSDDPVHEKEILDASREWLEIRSADVNFVLDTLLEKARSGEEGPYQRIDSEKIGLFGHSLGGATAVSVARQREDIDAVIDLEGTMFSEYEGYTNGEYIFRDDTFNIPILDVNSRDIYNLAQEEPDRQYVNFFVVEHALDGREVVVDGVGHLNFTDLPMISPILGKLLGAGDADAKICLENINSLMLNYFDSHLKGMPEEPLPEGCEMKISEA